MKIENIQMWVTGSGGIGHIVTRTDTRWTHTACGSLIIGGELEPRLPKRICGKCRAVLGKLKPSIV